MRYLICFFFVLSTAIFFGCNKVEQEEILDVQEQPTIKKDGMIVLGKKLDNPYSLENMTKAYESLIEKGALKSADKDKKLEATHLYIRFLPKNSTDLELLWTDKTLELFDYPLDYEVLGGETNYRDPSIPEGKLGWLYTVVPIKYRFPTVEFEILSECIIPKTEHIGLKSTGENDLFLKIEHESLLLTHNLNIGDALKSSGSCKPTGTFRVYNTNNSSYEGAMKVKVRVRSWFRIDAVYTDTNGKYTMEESFSDSNVKYDLIFENETGFKIWDDYGFASPTLLFMGDQPKEGYSRDFTTASVVWLWCTVNNGAYIYRTALCPNFGVAAPPSEIRIWTVRANLGWSGSAPMARQMSLDWSTLSNFITALGTIRVTTYISLVLPDIFIAPDYTDTKSTYRTLFHELAHSSHYTQAGNFYWLQYINGIVTNTVIGKDIYGDGTGPVDGYIGVGEMWGNYFGHVCMKNEFGYDIYWVSDEDWYNPGFLEKVLNFTTDVSNSEIFSCLNSNVNTISKLKTELKTKTNYATQVDMAYSKFTDWP